MRFGLFAVVAAGCASGTAAQGATDAPPRPGIDAKVYYDAPEVLPDAPHVLPDAGCTTTTTELLANPAFDLTPRATGWTEQNIDNNYPIVTNDTGLSPDSTPYRAWMGGFQGVDLGVASVTDVLRQDVAVPAGTIQLVLTGKFAVATSESGSTVYDTGAVDLIKANGTPIESVLSTNNASSATNWTPINHTFTANVAGQTVRLRFTTTNDDVNATSFYFDTLSLKATKCQ